MADISIMGATSANTGGITILDDVTVSSLPHSTDTTVGMYALGDAMAGGYSRFSTSTTYPTWFTGTNAISGTPACKSGSIYTNTAGGGGSTFWACANSLWGTALF